MRKFVGSNTCCSCTGIACSQRCSCIGLRGPSSGNGVDRATGKNILQDRILVSNMYLPTGIEIYYRSTGQTNCTGDGLSPYVSYGIGSISEFGYKSIPSFVMDKVGYQSTESFFSGDAESNYVNHCCYKADVDIPVGDSLEDGWDDSTLSTPLEGDYPYSATFAELFNSGWPLESDLSSGYTYLMSKARYMGLRGIEFAVQELSDVNGNTVLQGIMTLLPKELWIPKYTTGFGDTTDQIRIEATFASPPTLCPDIPSDSYLSAQWDGVSIEKIPFDDPLCSQGTWALPMRLDIPFVDVPVDTFGDVKKDFPWPYMGTSPSFYANDSRTHKSITFTPCTDGAEADECTVTNLTSETKAGADIDLSLSKICWDIDGTLGEGVGCWSNSRGGGCFPIQQVGMPANASPVENLTITEPNGTTWNQTEDAIWDSEDILVPVQSSPDVYVKMEAYYVHNTAGRKLRISVFEPPSIFGFGFQRDYTLELDKCGGGTITGLDDNNPSLSCTFEWPYGEDCAECETPETQYGCCELPDGTTQITDGVSACEGTLSGTFGGVGTSCPPTGCCTLPDDSTLSDVTEAHCTAQSGTWQQDTECPEPDPDPPAEDFDRNTSARVVVNSITLDAPDPTMTCTNNFELVLDSTPQTGSYMTDVNKEVDITGTIMGDNSYASTSGTSLSVNSKASVKFPNDTEYFVEVELRWSFGINNYYFKCYTDNQPISGIGNCPSFTLSGSFDQIDSLGSFWFQMCNFIFDANDLVGSYNITVECE